MFAIFINHSRFQIINNKIIFIKETYKKEMRMKIS